MKKIKNKESGVSETVGFIIIFGIVMTGIGIVTLYGYPALMSQQENANIKNMEKNLLVLQSDLKSLTFKSVPYQETAIQVSGGTLLVKEDPSPYSYFTIGNSSYTFVSKFEPGELRFISGSGDANLALENGAVHIRYWSDLNGSAMLSYPPWYYDPVTRTYVIYLIRVNGTEDLAQTGIGLVRMQLADAPMQEEYTITGDLNIIITYHANPEENYKIAWKNYFDRSDLNMTEVIASSGLNTSYKLGAADTLVIKKYNVTFLSL